MITMAFPVRLSVRDLKALLAPELQVPTEVLRVSVEGTTSHFLSLSPPPLFSSPPTPLLSRCLFSSGALLEEQLTLLELGVWPQGSTQMEVSSSNPTAHPLRPRRPAESSSAADVLTVRVQTGEEFTPLYKPPPQNTFVKYLAKVEILIFLRQSIFCHFY